MRYRQDHKNFLEMKALLTQAFKAIRRNKIVARQNFSCCGGCACSELGTILEKRTDQRGGVYYHRQDNDHLREDGVVYLGYGARPDSADDKAESEAIGREVVAALEAVGLVVTWNGDHYQRIMAALPEAA